MRIEVRREDGTAVVAPHGDIVASAAPELRPVLRDLVRSGLRELVVDLADSAMVDSMGVGLLLSAFNTVRASGGTFSMVNASGELLDLFHTLRMHQHFSISGR